ncbi:SCO6881 family protein [Kitasatospora aureofaciens]|uniref:SCO6881 family protein n=1 Tax=Kitasatospora aureofaciens TaxID=1894 RepID=UPI0027E14DB7|nr:conjugal transfer protein TrbL family protein [Kitasatospora aureofaciens]
MNLICGGASAIADSITSGIGNWIAKSCGELAASAVDMASRAVDETTRVDLSAGWFRDNYGLVLSIGLTMIVLTFILQLMRAAWRRDGQALGQAVTATVSSVLFAVTAISFTAVALTVVDALSRSLFQIANVSMADAVRRIVKVGELGVIIPLGWLVPVVAALGCAVGAVLYWGMMIFRKVSLLVLVVLAPLAAAGGPWEPTRDWRRKWIEATATLVFSKLVVTIVMLVGVSAIGQSDTKDGIQALSDIIAGLVVMALVLCAPFMVYKFIHWAGDGQSHDLHRSTAAGLQTASAAAKKAGQMAVTAGSGGAAGASAGAGAAGASPAGPSQVPGMQSTGTGQGGGGGGPEGPSTDTLAKATPTSFKYGEPQRSGGGDGGVPLVSRPATDRSDGDQGRALITRAGTSGTGSGAPAASGGSSPAADAHTAAGSPGLSTPGSSPTPTGGGPDFDPVIASPSGPAASGAGTGQRFTFPHRSPS